MTLATVGLLLWAAAPAAKEDVFKTSDGVGIFYRSVGSGPETVVIPVALLTSPYFDGLARNRRIVYYDPRGRGRSGLGLLENVSFARASQDLEELRAHLGAPQIAIIGFSGYGMEMALYALAHPGRTSRLVQLAPVPPVFRPWGEEGMAAREPRFDRKRLAAFEALQKKNAPGEAQCRALQQAVLPAVTAYPKRFADRDFDYCALENEWPDNTGKFYGQLLKEFDDLDLRPRLAELEFPRLVIHAAKDTFPLAGSEAWVRGHAGARIMQVDDAGHSAYRDQPEIVLSAIEAFLSGGWPGKARALP